MTTPRTLLFRAIAVLALGGCAAPTGAGGDALARADGPGCTLTAAEWRDRAWPVDRLVLGGRIYDAETLRVMLDGSDADASLALGRQLAATELNVAAGAEPPEAALREGHAWLTGGRTPLPHGVAPSSDFGRTGLRIATDLSAYNGGEVGPGACAR